MPLWLAVVLLLLSLLGMALSHRCLRKLVQSVCVILYILPTVAYTAYTGLTILFMDAVRSQPPVSQRDISVHGGGMENV